LYISNIKCEILNIKAQCWRDHYTGDRRYFGAEVLHLKNLSSMWTWFPCRLSTLFWSWCIIC